MSITSTHKFAFEVQIEVAVNAYVGADDLARAMEHELRRFNCLVREPNHVTGVEVMPLEAEC